jgi:hypothetical protein
MRRQDMGAMGGGPFFFPSFYVSIPPILSLNIFPDFGRIAPTLAAVCGSEN